VSVLADTVAHHRGIGLVLLGIVLVGVSWKRYWTSRTNKTGRKRNGDFEW